MQLVYIDCVQPTLGSGAAREKERVNIRHASGGIEHDRPYKRPSYQVDIMYRYEIKARFESRDAGRDMAFYSPENCNPGTEHDDRGASGDEDSEEGRSAQKEWLAEGGPVQEEWLVERVSGRR